MDEALFADKVNSLLCSASSSLQSAHLLASPAKDKDIPLPNPLVAMATHPSVILYLQLVSFIH